MKKTKRSIQNNTIIPPHLREKLNWTIWEILIRKNINDNKSFWKAIKPFLSYKVRSTNKMTLLDKEEIIMGE